MVMTVAVAVYALHEIIQPFGKLEILCIAVILMENVYLALKELMVD